MTIKSKVLIYENNPEAEAQLKSFCNDNELIGLKAPATSLFEWLASNTDLGGVIIQAGFKHKELDGYQLVRKIREQRPELPLFLRVEPNESVENAILELVVDSFSLNELSKLKNGIDSHLFSSIYPMPLIRGMQEISLEAIRASMRNCQIEMESPYLVKDQIIYGELMSLIPLESDWYRGFMMIQTTEQELVNLVKHGLTPMNPKDTDFRFVNALLNEMTNLIWGGIKNRFSNHSDGEISKTQVPISINHMHKYISFGTTDPQLCFHYKVKGPEPMGVVNLYQKFVFNLSWYPENFQNSEAEVNKMVESGELEFF